MTAPLRISKAGRATSAIVAVALIALAVPALAAAAGDADMPGMDHSAMPAMQHPSDAGMDHSMMPGMQQPSAPAMDHSRVPAGDHGGPESMQNAVPSDAPVPGKKPQDATSGMEMGPMQGGKAPPGARDPFASAEGTRNRGLPGNHMADTRLIGFLLVDKLEFNDASDTLRLDAEGWIGGDVNRLWLKADGERRAGRLGATRTEALWDRRFATYWSSQIGLRHDFGQGPGRNWAAIGVQGLARYWFNVQATAYLGESGRTAARLEAEYDLLFTQRLILQPTMEMNLYGRRDAARDIGSGLSDMSLGLRLRYEMSRQFAPYVGVSWQRKFGDTADFARAAGEDVRSTRVIAGVRMWF